MAIFSMTKGITREIMTGFMVAMLLFVSVPSFARAQTVYQPQTVEQQIAYLYGLIAQLQAQLQTMRTYQYSGTNSYYQTVSPYGYTGSWGSYRIELDTLSATDVEEEEAKLRANIDLDGASYANGWFEYGEFGDMDERTTAVQITNRGDDTRSYTRVVDDLDDDTRYWYRAVAEGPDGRRVYGDIRSFTTDDDGRSSSNSSSRYDDEPTAETEDASYLGSGKATLEGYVDMNDFYNGIVFFVWGEYERLVEDVEDEDEYADIEPKGDDLQKVRVDSDLDGDEDYEKTVTKLDIDSEYFYRICVQYQDEDDDETLECGDVEDFDTDE